MDEIELKFLNINKAEIEAKLQKIGAKKVFVSDSKNLFFKTKGGEFSARDQEKKCLRLRQMHEKNFLTYKGPKQDSKYKIHKEIEIEVNDFDKTKKLLEGMGFEHEDTLTKKRIHYELDNVCFEIDEIKGIPPYLEIETKTEQDMEDICKKLNLDIDKGDNRIIIDIYPEKF